MCLPEGYAERWYQVEASDALAQDINFFNPVIAIPTGGGKTVILGRFIYKFLEKNPLSRVLVLSHTKEILFQDWSTIKQFFPGIPIGLYSAGLKSKTVDKITVAGIQSAYKHPELFNDFDLVVVDEAHLISNKGSSMYRTFLDTLDKPKVCGMSATVFRKGTGYIYEGEDSLFNKLSYDLTSVENFNRLIDEGYLCPLISKRAELELDSTKVKTTAGDYNLKQLSQKCDREEITEQAVSEAIRIGKHNYKSWLVFAIDISHADHITEKFIAAGYKTRALHSKTNKDREEIIQQFKNKEIQILVSVGMITTGFDAPNIDLIVMLRPTKSPVLHIQMLGRGLRILEGKEHCLVLDFSGNIRRLGPINCVEVPTKKKKGEAKGEPPVKECPVCHCYQFTMSRICDVCGHVFQFKIKLTGNADNKEVVMKTPDKWLMVDKVLYYIHPKAGRPDSLKVIYVHGGTTTQEFICLDHSGYAQHFAKNWVRHRWHDNSFPQTVASLYKNHAKLKVPTRILVDKTQKYDKIKNAEF